MAKASHEAVDHEAQVPLCEAVPSLISVLLLDAVVGAGHVLSVALIPPGQAVPHVGLQSVQSPMGREAVCQGSFCIELGGGVIAKDDGRDSRLRPLGIDKFQHVLLLLKAPQG